MFDDNERRENALDIEYYTVETQYNKILGTKKFCLLYQIFCDISSPKTIQNKENIFIGTGEISLLYQVFCYIRSLYIEFPL